MQRYSILSVGVLLGTISSVASLALSQEPATAVKTSAWTSLFDGTSLDEWRGYEKIERPSGWVIENQELHRKAGGGDLVTVGQYDDFELSLEWRVAEGSNSGIMYRIRLRDRAPYMSGLEYQVLDKAHADAKSPLTHAGALYALYPARPDLCKPRGEWNLARIVVRGNHVEHWLNGEQVVDCEMWSDDWNQRFKKSKFNRWSQFGRTRKGHIALQDHGDPVWYRDIKIRKLSGASVDPAPKE